MKMHFQAAYSVSFEISLPFDFLRKSNNMNGKNTNHEICPVKTQTTSEKQHADNLTIM
jgi:hypothetical protein